MVLTSRSSTATATWTQEVRCKPGAYYLVEATVRCDLHADDPGDGFVLSVQPILKGRAEAKPRTTPGLHRSDQRLDVRGWYQVPDGVRRLSLSLGIVRSRGTVEIYRVRMLSIIEPDEISHPMSIPPPPVCLPAPRNIRHVRVCTHAGPARTIVCRLTEYFGESRVVTTLPAEFNTTNVSEDALLLPDPVPPRSLASLAALLRLAERRVVVISLPAFASLTHGKASIRRVEQPEDPMFAKIALGNPYTRGFALADVFSFAWQNADRTHFAQRQFRKTPRFKAFLAAHGFEVLLASMCCEDATSDRPIALYKGTPGGGLFVLDIEPAEEAGSTFGEPGLALFLLLNILGQQQCHGGQYTVAARTEAGLRGLLREMGARFSSWTVHEEDRPPAEITDQLITVGGEDQSYGLPLPPRPVILIRTGLSPGDLESTYGVLLWLKQLVRMPPHPCPYGDSLSSKFRLAWVPRASQWRPNDGFRRESGAGEAGMELEVEPGLLSALIDVVSRPRNQVRVVMPAMGGVYQRAADWMPVLASVFPAGDYFGYSPPEGAGFADRTMYAWRRMRFEPRIVVDPAAFGDACAQEVLRAGGRAFRIELPGGEFDFTANSIQRTDLAVTLLEHLVGLQYGLLAVNRQLVAVTLNGLPPIQSGQAVIVDANDPFFRSASVQAG